MASSGKRKTTMAKLQRESRLRERRAEKKVRKAARRLAASQPETAPTADDGLAEGDALPEGDALAEGDRPAEDADAGPEPERA